MKSNKFFLAGWVLVLLTGCTHPSREGLFKEADSSQTGIHFSNDITESDSVNPFVNEYVYAGGGVGIGDFNNDGLQDIFFTGNQVSSRLYINKGKNQFEDITSRAAVNTTSWCTGVSIIDINNDGFDDIYVCVSGNLEGRKRRNLLFINQHNLTFKEQAKEYGLDYSGYSTQAAFFDYDKDGDLDMYLLNHRLDKFRPNNIVARDTSGNSPAADRLFVNRGTDPALKHPVFQDVSRAAGIGEDGYGLGVAVSDFNGDNWPDIYVSNDYLANDELWLNNKNGTFTNCIAASVGHQSYSSMGVDAADINNDARPDLMTLDMMPEKNSRKKTMYSFLSYERYQMERDQGYEPQFIRNMLQVNNGVTGKGNTAIPAFSEIGQLAGISETDWSWSVLLGDFDNDGWKDIHITNGIWRDLTNADFVAFRADRQMEDNSKKDERKVLMEQLDSYKPILLPNYLYHNNGNYTFSDITAQSGANENSASNGAAYADLDNDGDLDLVINNLNSEASLLVNTTREKAGDSSHYLECVLNGPIGNRAAVGAKVAVFYGKFHQVLEQYPVRGYLSSVDKKLHFGLGTHPVIDSITIRWPDDKCQTIRNTKADQVLLLNYEQSRVQAPVKDTAQQENLFEDVTGLSKAVYRHQETFFNDYSIQRLLPQKYSQPGPAISAADVNGDGLTDFFIGGAYNYSGELFIQDKKGTFTGTPLVKGKKEEEDTGSGFFDADGNGTMDMLVAGGSDEFSPGSPVYKPRLYGNDGKGHFTLNDAAVPASVNTSASVVASADFDGDGNTEIFVGGRVSASFPVSPASYILRNDHGVLTDVTEKVCPALKAAGMVTAAVWTDFDNDHQMDLVVTGEWMPIRFFRNTNGVLTEVTSQRCPEAMDGQWRSLIAADIDHDGDMDLVAGNLGLNNKFKVSPHQPLMLYAEDIDQNGVVDPVSFYYIKNEQGERELYPAISRDLLAEQVPLVKKKFQYYRDYAAAGFADIYPASQQNALLTLKCTETRSCVFENTGKGKFIMHELPVEAQFAPVNAIACEDFDGDGNADLLLAGNEYQTEIMTGRYDASYGLFLKGDGKNHFTAVDPRSSGFIVKGDVKDMKVIRGAAGNLMVLVGINDDYMKIFRVNKKDIDGPKIKGTP